MSLEITQIQDYVKHIIVNINQNTENNALYLFDNGGYSPHLTLAYITNEELDLQELDKKEPKLADILAAIAANRQSIDLTENFNNATFDIWPGKFEIIVNTHKKKNYATIVLKLKISSPLVQLADSLDQKLQQFSIYVQRRFPFSAHVTIGRLYELNDQDISGISTVIKSALASQCIALSDSACSIDSFELKAHNGDYQSFTLFP